MSDIKMLGVDGLALGLYVSRKIVERQGGHLSVRGWCYGEGSTFAIAPPPYVDPENGEAGVEKLVPQAQAQWTIAH